MPGLFTRISIDPKTLATCCDCASNAARGSGDDGDFVSERPGSAFHNAVRIVWLGKLKRFSFTPRSQAYADVALTILTCV